MIDSKTKDRFFFYTLDQGRLPAELVCSSVVIHQLHQPRFVTCEKSKRGHFKIYSNTHMWTLGALGFTSKLMHNLSMR